MSNFNIYSQFFKKIFYSPFFFKKAYFSTKKLMAERMGFEPMIEFPLYTLSKRAPSTTRPPLHYFSLDILSTPIKASCGISTFPNCLALALPFFCFSSNFLFLSTAPPP